MKSLNSTIAKIECASGNAGHLPPLVLPFLHMPCEFRGTVAEPIPNFSVKLPCIHTWRDTEFRSAAENMALDEALFLWSSRNGNAAARFYHWDHPALTIGYFGTGLPDSSVPIVRRYTGGGLVEHGEDLTFLLTLPVGSPPVLAPASDRYRWIHAAFADSLADIGIPASLAPPSAPGAGGPCFAHPVPWDLLDPVTGLKIGGGAQRRSRGSVIHQGSLRLPEAYRIPTAPWIDRCLERLAESTEPLATDICSDLLREASDLCGSRYQTAAWNFR